MSDPFDSLRSFGEGPAHRRLPAAEVRRRGERMRRRRNAMRVVGGAAAVAVITTGGLALGTSRPDAVPQPPTSSQSPGPSPDSGPTPTPPKDTASTTTIPRRFPIAAGYPTRAEVTDEQVLAGPSPELQVFIDYGACGQKLYPITEPADRLAVMFRQPEDFRARVLTTYPDVQTAREVLSRLVSGHRACPRDTYEDTPEPVTLIDVRQTGLGDEGYVVVTTYEQDGAPAIGLGLGHAVRVGNALLLSSRSTEGGPDPQSVDEAVRSETAGLSPVVDAMCVFSAAGCQPDAGPGYLLDEAGLRDATGVKQFHTVTNTQSATLACQADWLSALGPETADYRRFEARGRSNALGAWAGTAVLGFGDEASAAAAYDTLTTDWLADCAEQVDPTHGLVTAVDSGLTDPHTGQAAGGRYYWRGVKLAAPETCVACDAAWDDHQGVGLVGRRLVLLHVAYGGDMQLGADDSRSPMDGLMTQLMSRVRAGS